MKKKYKFDFILNQRYQDLLCKDTLKYSLSLSLSLSLFLSFSLKHLLFLSLPLTYIHSEVPVV